MQPSQDNGQCIATQSDAQAVMGDGGGGSLPRSHRGRS